MKNFKDYFWLAFFAAAFFAGCSTSNQPARVENAEIAFASPTALTATLTNGNSVILHWKNNTMTDGGVWVEYTTAGYDFIKLDAFPSDENTTQFLHANLAPQTTFIYRINPFFGAATKLVEITTGTSTNNLPPLADGPIASTNEISSGGKKYSIRSIQTFAKAAPTDFSATLSSDTSVDLHWQVHASDADGCLLEVSARADGDFVPCALLPPDATGFRKTGLPAQTKCYFRVRAFFYGKPSASASVTTLPEK